MESINNCKEIEIQSIIGSGWGNLAEGRRNQTIQKIVFQNNLSDCIIVSDHVLHYYKFTDKDKKTIA